MVRANKTAAVATERGRWRRKKPPQAARPGQDGKRGFGLAHWLAFPASLPGSGVSQRRIHHLDLALLAQFLQPVVKRTFNLPLEQNLLDAGSHFLQCRKPLRLRLLRQKRIAVVALHLLRGDLNALPEATFDKPQYLNPVPHIVLNPFRRQAVRN